jgi:hypothetical protein
VGLVRSANAAASSAGDLWRRAAFRPPPHTIVAIVLVLVKVALLGGIVGAVALILLLGQL